MIGSAWSLILLWRNLLNKPFVSTELKPLNINMTTFGTYKINDKVILLLTSDASNASFFCDATHMLYHHINATTKIFPSLVVMANQWSINLPEMQMDVSRDAWRGSFHPNRSINRFVIHITKTALLFLPNHGLSFMKSSAIRILKISM